MESAETIITSKLEELRAELAKKAEIIRKSTEESPWIGLPSYMPENETDRRQKLEIASLAAQVSLLEELKDMLDKQQMTTQAHFLAIKDRDERSSRQNVRFTVVSSAVSLFIGWALSLLGSPAAVLHAFGR